MTAPEPVVSLGITAAPIHDHHRPADSRGVHMLRMGATSFIYFNKETAAQWLTVLTEIAEEK